MKQVKHMTFLIIYTAIPPLQLSQALTFASEEHAEDIGRLGLTGHISSSDDITIKKRIENHLNKAVTYFGENILYGKKMPWSILVDMLIGFGLRNINNNNRLNILNESFDTIGICMTKHLSFKWVCVIVFGKDIGD